MSTAASATTARIAAIQMVSGPEVAGNLEVAGRLIDAAAARGAQLVALPEYFGIIDRMLKPSGRAVLQAISYK